MSSAGSSPSLGLRLLATVRANNWWSSKLPPLLAVAYAVLVRSTSSPGQALPALATATLSLCALAWYAHVVNDLCDVEEDRRGGKTNRMEAFSPLAGWLLALVLLMAGLVAAMAPAGRVRPALWVLAANYALFTLYSVPPTRLKRRGWLGGVTDATGAHVLPTLFMILAVGGVPRTAVGVVITAAACVWSFAAGLRGIIVHQFADRDADLRAGLTTIATARRPERGRDLVLYRIVPVEMGALAIFTVALAHDAPLFAVAMVLFALVEWLKMRSGWILPMFEPAEWSREPYRPLLNNDAYELWLPIALAVQLAVLNPAFTVVPVLHVILFFDRIRGRAQALVALLRELATRRKPRPVPTRGARPRSGSAAPRAKEQPAKELDVVIGATYWTLNGVNVFAVNLARGLREAGMRAHILATEADTQLVSVHEAFMERPTDVPIVHLAVKPWATWGAHWGETIRYLESLAPCIYIPNSDWRHSCACPRLSDEVAVVGVVHSDDPLHYDHVARLGDYWNAAVAVSQVVADKTAARLPTLGDRLVTIPIGAKIASVWPERPPSAGPLRLVYHGALKHHQKRVLDLPRVVAAAAAKGVPVRLTIAGGGPDEARLREEAQPLVERGMVQFAGVVPHDRIPELLEQHDVYLLVSDFEGLPNALLEAMGRGCVPVVSRMAGGAMEIVRDGENGFIAPVGDAEAFADRLAELYRDPERRRAMSRQAFASVQGSYRLETMVRAYQDLFVRVLEDARLKRWVRPRGELRPPPAELGGEGILPIPLPFQVPTVGSFASEDDWLEYESHVSGASVPLRLEAPVGTDAPTRSATRRALSLADLQVIVAAPIWTRNGVNVLSENLVRGFIRQGLKARLLLTEESTVLVRVDQRRLARPRDLPVDELPVGFVEGWGAHWGAMQKYLEDHAPCVYFPTFDWRHSCVIPRVPGRAFSVAAVYGEDPLSIDQVRRLATFLSAVVVTQHSAARDLRHLVPLLADRTVVIPEGRKIPGSVPERSRFANDPVDVVVCGTALGALGASPRELLAVLKARGVTARLTIIGSADHPETALPVLETEPRDLIRMAPWPVATGFLESAVAIVLALEIEYITGEAWEAMGAGCVPLVAKAGSVPEFFRHGQNSFLFHPGDLGSVADYVALLARDDARRAAMSRRAHDLAWRGVTRSDAMIQAYIELFTRILHEHSSGVGPSHRRPGPMEPPPSRVAGMDIFPPKLPYRVRGVGRFPSKADYQAYQRYVRQPAPPKLPNS